MENQHPQYKYFHALDYLQGYSVVLQNPDGSLGTQLPDDPCVRELLHSLVMWSMCFVDVLIGMSC